MFKVMTISFSNVHYVFVLIKGSLMSKQNEKSKGAYTISGQMCQLPSLITVREQDLSESHHQNHRYL